jgi:hypothetical protein
MLSEYFTAYLAANGQGTAGIDLFTASQPDHAVAANCVTIYDESAITPLESNNCPVDTSGVHVLIRNSSYVTGRNKANTIHGLMAAYAGVPSAGAPTVVMTNTTTQPTHIGKDEKDYHEFSIHYAMRYAGAAGSFRT